MSSEQSLKSRVEFSADSDAPPRIVSRTQSMSTSVRRGSHGPETEGSRVGCSEATFAGCGRCSQHPKDSCTANLLEFSFISHGWCRVRSWSRRAGRDAPVARAAARSMHVIDTSM